MSTMVNKCTIKEIDGVLHLVNPDTNRAIFALQLKSVNVDLEPDSAATCAATFYRSEPEQ